ncbi:hypothetical protein Trydic_g2254, partial [Trypoxylus dichotomus]
MRGTDNAIDFNSYAKLSVLVLGGTKIFLVLLLQCLLPLVYGEPLGTCPVEDVGELVYLPDQSDCTQFFKCDNGVPVLFTCPDGLYFNPTINICDFPQDSGCDTSNVPVETNPPDEQTEPAAEEPTEGPDVPDYDVPIGDCPSVESENATLLAHAYDCGRYFECAFGVPVLMYCPEGLHYNIELCVCDYPQGANCRRPRPPAPVEPDEPTEQPTEEPAEPTEEPTEETDEPTEEPIELPTVGPTEEPTEEPDVETDVPTENPDVGSEEPTEEPDEPTEDPDVETEEPTEEPLEPTEDPTEEPDEPTEDPDVGTEDPTEEPLLPTEGEPTEDPDEPTVEPTEEPDESSEEPDAETEEPTE